MRFILQDYEIGRGWRSQISGTAITTVLEGRKECNGGGNHTNYHHIAWSLLIKPKNKNISIFFLFFCPKSISIFNTTAFCNRQTITHGQSKPGNIKTFSTFLVWCDFWKQCLSEMHFFHLHTISFLNGPPRYHNTVRNGKEESHQEDKADALSDASWLHTLHFQSCSIPRGFCRERRCQASPQKAGYCTEKAGSWLAYYFNMCTQAS